MTPNDVMKATEQDEKCPDLQNDTPRTKEAVARWMQGKVNWAEEMAKLELELYEECRLNGMGSEREATLNDSVRSLQEQLDCAMWCLERADKRAKDWQDCAGRLIDNGMPNSWKNSVEWDKAKAYHKHMSKVQPHNL